MNIRRKRRAAVAGGILAAAAVIVPVAVLAGNGLGDDKAPSRRSPTPATDRDRPGDRPRRRRTDPRRPRARPGRSAYVEGTATTAPTARSSSCRRATTTTPRRSATRSSASACDERGRQRRRPHRGDDGHETYAGPLAIVTAPRRATGRVRDDRRRAAVRSTASAASRRRSARSTPTSYVVGDHRRRRLPDLEPARLPPVPGAHDFTAGDAYESTTRVPSTAPAGRRCGSTTPTTTSWSPVDHRGHRRLDLRRALRPPGRRAWVFETCDYQVHEISPDGRVRRPALPVLLRRARRRLSFAILDADGRARGREGLDAESSSGRWAGSTTTPRSPPRSTQDGTWTDHLARRRRRGAGPRRGRRGATSDDAVPPHRRG